MQYVQKRAIPIPPLDPSGEHPLYELVTTTAGAVSIRHKILGEIMHNPVGPWVEANALYVEQPRLLDLFKERSSPGLEDTELTIFDIGLGAAANALAAIHCHRQVLQTLGDQCQTKPKLKLVSFERDMDLLKFALANSKSFPHFHGFESAIEGLIKDGIWKDHDFIWLLREGDFLELVEQEVEKPHLIYFDPYSPKVNQDMWSLSCFQKLRRICRPRHEGGTLLYTYSIATPVRVGLLTAGFFVGEGQATGLKHETTVAATEIDSLSSPLDERWLIRWRKSHTPHPFGAAPQDYLMISKAVADHPQFLR